MMSKRPIPKLSKQEINAGLLNARNSKKHRYPKLLHKPGDEFNRVFNFIMQDSYMQPHLHPGDEKIENIYLVEGELVILFFDDQGMVTHHVLMKKDGVKHVKVPAFVWHTYVMLSEWAVTYETMMGKYDPQTWKDFAEWAATEDALDSIVYLNSLKEHVAKNRS